MSDVVAAAVIPAAPVLLPRWQGLTDPIGDIRHWPHQAASWLARQCDEIRILAADDQAQEIGEYFATGQRTTGRGVGLLVVADGTARRGEKAPGHFDPRAAGYDEVITAALRDGDLATLRGLDLELGAELLAAGALTLVRLAEAVGEVRRTWLDLAEAPFGVQYWVARWECATAAG